MRIDMIDSLAKLSRNKWPFGNGSVGSPENVTSENAKNDLTMIKLSDSSYIPFSKAELF